MNPKEKQRAQISQKAAQIIAESGITDYAKAKNKACEQLGLGHRTQLPSNKEIEAALVSYLNTFDPDHTARIGRMRETAARTMSILSAFKPQLTGPVLSGTASMHHAVEIFVTAQTHEEVARCLIEHAIPFQNVSSELRTGKNSRNTFHGFRFDAGEISIRLTVISAASHQYPADPVTGLAPETASINSLKDLITLANAGF